MLLSNLNLLATAPGGVARLRELILTLAVQGKLVPQDPDDEPASILLQKIRAEKDRLIEEKKIRRSKPLDRIDESESCFELPSNWAWERLGNLGDWGAGATPSRSNNSYYGGNIPWFKSGELTADFISESEETVTDAALRDCSLRLNQIGDVLIAMYGATIGKTAILSVVATTNQAVCACTPFKGLSNTYLLLLLKALKPYFIGLGAGGAQPNISREKIVATVIGLPPLAEQSRIVARVEELMRLCDALEAKGQLEATQHAQLLSTLLGTLTSSATPEELADNWQRVAQHFDLLLDRPEAIDALEQTLLQLAVRGLLVPQDPADEPASVLLQKIRAEKDRLITEGKIKKDKPLPPVTDEEKPFELPVGWEWVRMGAVVNASEAGWSPACIGSPRRPGLWGVLKVSAVSWGEFDANANKELPSDLVPRPEYEVRDGDFLLSRANTAELVARSVVVEQAEPKLMLSDKIIRLAVSSQMNRSFLNMANNASYAREHYAVNVSGTSSSMKNVSREVVLALPVPLPSLAEQSRIVTRVTQLRRLCADLRQRLAERDAVQARLAEALAQSVA